jgi:polyhydroxyalkanoate depolymerase
MLYLAYETHSRLLSPAREAASWALGAFGSAIAGADDAFLSNCRAAWELVERAGLTHVSPPFGIESVQVGNREVPVTEREVLVTPFGTLRHFHKDTAVAQPRVLVVAPLSGHFATLLRNTVRTLLQDHDVFITDWHNARDVPLGAGRFGFDDYCTHLVRFLEEIGPGAHVVAVCQPCVQVLATTALMAQSGNPAVPRSMTLMAGPIDTRVNPTRVNELANEHDMTWFEANLIATVPWMHPGAGRRVYPGFVQLTAFMSMNLQRHIKANTDLHGHLARGETEKAETIKTFYDAYFAVLDLAAEFYLETIDKVFQRALLARGELVVEGERIDPAAITRTALLTVEGERDDICALGQTVAAHDLCSRLKPYRKRHHMQAGVGHYGVFSGRKWDNQIYPIVRNTILASE